MTVKVTITHQEPTSNRALNVHVVEVDVAPDGSKQPMGEYTVYEVKPGASVDVYVHRNQSLMVEEQVEPLPAPPSAVAKPTKRR